MLGFAAVDSDTTLLLTPKFNRLVTLMSVLLEFLHQWPTMLLSWPVLLVTVHSNCRRWCTDSNDF